MTRLTLSWTSKPCGSALTMSAMAGVEASRINPHKSRRMFTPVRVERRDAPPTRLGTNDDVKQDWNSAVEDGVDRVRDFLGTLHAVDPANQAHRLVEWQDRRGLGAIFGHPGPHRRFI